MLIGRLNRGWCGLMMCSLTARNERNDRHVTTAQAPPRYLAANTTDIRRLLPLGSELAVSASACQE
jgi:hypothetical protein